MRHTANVLLVTGLTMVASGPAGADVIVRLHTGREFRATTHWVEGGLVKFEHRGGVVGFPREAVAEIVETPAATRAGATAEATAAPLGDGSAAVPEEPGAAAAGEARVARPAADPKTRSTKASAAGASVAADVPGEDLVTRQERLDKLAVDTFQELINSRHREEPEEKLDALQAKLDEINRLRVDTLNRLKEIR